MFLNGVLITLVSLQEEKSSQEKEKEQWYVIHTYAGYENRVKNNLEKRATSMGMTDKIRRVLVPVEDRLVVKEGKRKIVQRKIYPGYVLVEMDLNDDSWYLVRHTPGVTGFVGSGAKPLPLQPAEAKQILRQIGVDAPKPKVDFAVGESVRITSGPFENFIGTIEEVNPEKGRIKVLVSMFGRETPLELDFSQAEKLY